MPDRPDHNTAQNTAQAVEIADLGRRSIDAAAELTRQNMETMLTVAHSAVQSFAEMASEFSAFSRASFDRASGAAQAMTSTTSPNELIKMHADYARQEAEAAMAEMTKLSEVMIKTTRESFAAAVDGAKARGGRP